MLLSTRLLSAGGDTLIGDFIAYDPSNDTQLNTTIRENDIVISSLSGRNGAFFPTPPQTMPQIVPTGFTSVVNGYAHAESNPPYDHGDEWIDEAYNISYKKVTASDVISGLNVFALDDAFSATGWAYTHDVYIIRFNRSVTISVVDTDGVVFANAFEYDTGSSASSQALPTLSVTGTSVTNTNLILIRCGGVAVSSSYYNDSELISSNYYETDSISYPKALLYQEGNTLNISFTPTSGPLQAFQAGVALLQVT